MELVQRQTQQLTQQTLQSLALLQMSTVELEAYVQELAQENPIIDLEPPRSEQEAPRDQELFRRVKWLEDSDRQNRYYQRLDAEELDPLAQVGTDGGLEESLSNFLFRQIQQLDLDESAKQLLCYLSACLDEDGYFRIPLDELSRTSGISQRRLARTLELLRSLEPAGVGASSLSQCLELQLLRNKRAVIVTDEEGKYKGLVSLRMVANRYVSAMDHCDGDDCAKDLENAANDLAASLSQPVSELIEEDVVFLNKDDLLKDSAPSILMSELCEGIVLDDEGHCIGIVTRTDVAKRPKRKIILVDHNERSQAANGIDEAEVIEIIDHHRIGDVSTANPIRFMNMPVGSSATIVALQFMENAVEIPRSIAAVLLSAIMTDTVILKSPTATQIDEEVAEKLAAIVGSPVKDFGMKVLSYRGGDADLPIEKLVTADSKEFVVGDDTILIAQHETVTLDVVMQREDEIRKFLSDLCEKNDYAYVLLLVTDIFEEGSMFIVEGLHGHVDRVFGIDSSKSVWVPGILSRKKQVAAPLLEL